MLWVISTFILLGVFSWNIIKQHKNLQAILAMPIKALEGVKTAVLAIMTGLYTAIAEYLHSLPADSLTPLMGLHWAVAFGQEIETKVVFFLSLIITTLHIHETTKLAKAIPVVPAPVATATVAPATAAATVAPATAAAIASIAAAVN